MKLRSKQTSLIKLLRIDTSKSSLNNLNKISLHNISNKNNELNSNIFNQSNLVDSRRFLIKSNINLRSNNLQYSIKFNLSEINKPKAKAKVNLKGLKQNSILNSLQKKEVLPDNNNNNNNESDYIHDTVIQSLGEEALKYDLKQYTKSENKTISINAKTNFNDPKKSQNEENDENNKLLTESQIAELSESEKADYYAKLYLTNDIAGVVSGIKFIRMNLTYPLFYLSLSPLLISALASKGVGIIFLYQSLFALIPYGMFSSYLSFFNRDFHEKFYYCNNFIINSLIKNNTRPGSFFYNTLLRMNYIKKIITPHEKYYDRLYFNSLASCLLAIIILLMGFEIYEDLANTEIILYYLGCSNTYINSFKIKVKDNVGLICAVNWIIILMLNYNKYCRTIYPINLQIITLHMIIISLLYIFYFQHKVTTPIKEAAERYEKLADNDSNYIKINNEINDNKDNRNNLLNYSDMILITNEFKEIFPEIENQISYTNTEQGTYVNIQDLIKILAELEIKKKNTNALLRKFIKNNNKVYHYEMNLYNDHID